MTIAGIDPGKTGALAILHDDSFIEFFDVPSIKVKGKEEPAWSQWAFEWRTALNLSGVEMIVIEQVSAMPGQGVTSMFNFGGVFRFVHALACGVAPIEFVRPATWKAKLGLLNSGKSASREKCRTLFPSSVPYLTRVKDDGRAEAALLAYYGRSL